MLREDFHRQLNAPLLFTPGPTPTPEFLRDALAKPTIHHRTKEFETIFAEVRESLSSMMGLPEVLLLASSGTGAMEASLSNLARRKILSINSGKFGERFGGIGRGLGLEVVEIKNEWDTPVSLDQVERVMAKEGDIDCICMQICESSGGLAHPYKEIFAFIKEKYAGVMTIADGITALGVEMIDTSNIDALIGGSQKAFMLPPGLAFVGLSHEALALIESGANAKGRGYYFGLGRELKNQRRHTTAYTPATTIITGLKAYFDWLDSIGLSVEGLYSHTERLARATRKACDSIGLKVYPKVPSNSMTVLESKHSQDLIGCLKEDFGIMVADGQDHLKGKILRINHMGYVPWLDCCFVVTALELGLQSLGLRQFDSTANRIFCEDFLF